MEVSIWREAVGQAEAWFGVDPTDFEPQSYYDRARGCRIGLPEHSRVITRVDVDTSTLKIVAITSRRVYPAPVVEVSREYTFHFTEMVSVGQPIPDDLKYYLVEALRAQGFTLCACNKTVVPDRPPYPVYCAACVPCEAQA